MAHKTDNPDHPNTLPPPELNPLLNPLLGLHMGRWAEVYFTNPPERRDHAVWELLRELEAEKSSGIAPATAPSTDTHAGYESAPAVAPHEMAAHGEASETSDARDRRNAPPLVDAKPDLTLCTACGFENPARQRFCGMCGTRLAETVADTSSPALAPSPSAVVETNPQFGLNQTSRESFTPSQSSELSPTSTSEEAQFQKPGADSPRHVLEDFPWRRDEASLFRIVEEVRPRGVRGTLLRNFPEDAGSRRRYLIAAVAVLILAGGFLGWRALQNSSRAVAPSAPAAQEQAPASPAAKSQPSSTPAEASPPHSTVLATDIAATASASSPVATKTDAAAAVSTTSREPAAHTAAQPSNAATSADPFLPQTNESGAADLAMARSYLQGTNGQPPNISEATSWLWRAVSKQNVEATLLLADLYLKGDGVPKNCEQARVLLDAAARKGSKDAAERLRHLDAFGCA